MSSSQSARGIWFKSSHSAPDNDCVEVMFTVRNVAMRDSKDPEANGLTLTPEAYNGLLAVAREQ